MKGLRVNKDKITHIRLYDEERTNCFYCKEKRTTTFFGLIERSYYEDGYYNGGEHNYGTRCWARMYFPEDVKKYKDIFVRNNEVIIKAHIEIYVGVEKLKTKYFNSLREAKDYCDVYFFNVKVLEE